MQLIALETRSAAATNSGGLVFFPAAVPDAELRAARPAHPADGGGRAIMVALNVRMIRHYD